MPAAASVHGTAPIMTNTAVALTVLMLPERSRRLTDSTVAVPCTAATSVSAITSIRGDASIRSIRYRDIDELSPLPRTTTRTLRARDAR